MANKPQTVITEEREQEIIAHMEAKRIIDEHTWAIEPYTDNLPYDRERVVAECHFFLRHEAACRYEIGKRLLILNEKEDFQTFRNLIQDEFGGIHKSTAYNYIAFAKKCTELPRVKQFGENNWAKVLALMNGCTDEQLKEIEERGVMGKALDEFDGMSVRDFKRLIIKLKDNFDKTLAVEIHSIKLERDGAIRQRDEAIALLPKEEDITWQLKQFEHVQKLANSFIIACRKFIFDKRMKADENRHIAGAIDKLLIETRNDFRELARDWRELTPVED
jgi:hypothetical protein